MIPDLFLRKINFIRVWDEVSKKLSTRLSADTADVVALGILVLAIAAALVAVVVAIGFVYGRASGPDAVKIITACVGGSTISGIVAALLGRGANRRKKS
jgi:hypothetical protein